MLRIQSRSLRGDCEATALPPPLLPTSEAKVKLPVVLPVALALVLALALGALPTGREKSMLANLVPKAACEAVAVLSSSSERIGIWPLVR